MNVVPEKVLVSYAYGFSGDLGGGPYNRRDLSLPEISRTPDWQVAVSKEIPPKPGEVFSSLVDAISEWNNVAEGKFGIISIIDNYTYDEDISATEIKVPAASRLIVTGAEWNEVNINGVPSRIPGKIEPDGIRPHIKSDVVIKGTSSQSNSSPGEIIFDGLLIEGKLSVESKPNEQLGSLKLIHSTLVPGNEGIKLSSSNENLKILIQRSICGPVQIQKLISSLIIEESIIDNKNNKALSVKNVDLEIEKCTIFGDTECRTITASNSIFTGKINAKLLQEGCMRFSYIPDKSKVPRRFNCQPDLAIQKLQQPLIDNVKSRLIPNFTSEILGNIAMHS